MRQPSFTKVRHTISIHLNALNRRVVHWTTLSTQRHGLAFGAELTRSKPALLVENAFVRQQVIVLQRQVVRPHLTPLDRLLVALANRTRLGRSALLLVQPDTVRRWPRQGLRLVWKARSCTTT